MMKGAQDEIAKGPDAHLDEPEMIKKDRAKMTSNVKKSAMRRNDNPQGDKTIVPGGTQLKDPAAMKAESFSKTVNAIRQAYTSMYETEEELNELSTTTKKNYLKKATGADGDGESQSLANLKYASGTSAKDRQRGGMVPDTLAHNKKDMQRAMKNRRKGIERAAGKKVGTQLAKAASRAGKAGSQAVRTGADDDHSSYKRMNKQLSKINKKIG